MDVSQRTIAIRKVYGGSDRVAPSFNAPQYVRHGSSRDPLDLGSIPEGDLLIDARLGGESGSQTLFFQFTLERPARLAGRIAPTQRYTDQYLSFALNDAQGERISGNGEGYGTFLFPFLPESSVESVLGAQSYVVNGYWQDGYAASEGFTEQSATATVRIEPRLIPNGDILPPGEYRAVVSSSQWIELTLRLQLSSRGTVNLSGEAPGALALSGRLSPLRLRGEALLPLVPTARISRLVQLGGEATLPLAPSATLTRVSPFGS